MDKREAPRISFSTMVNVKFESLEEFSSLCSKNISIKGIFLETDDPLPVGNSVHLEFTVAGDDSPLIKVDGRVTRTVKPEPDNTSIIPGMGIEFLNLDLESEFIIQSLIE
ncbi:MAG: PilZ domain-containing protein [Deltaproteobacteria bacterium]|nr:MAG: PilZ domain-containing protein [Deltaproteobacteria bacterium]